MSDYLPDDPADRYPLTDDMFAYAELRADIEAQRGDWPAGSAMHVWADELVEIMDRNETYQAAWLTWLKPHEQGLAAGEPVSDAVEASPGEDPRRLPQHRGGGGRARSRAGRLARRRRHQRRQRRLGGREMTWIRVAAAEFNDLCQRAARASPPTPGDRRPPSRSDGVRAENRVTASDQHLRRSRPVASWATTATSRGSAGSSLRSAANV